MFGYGLTFAHIQIVLTTVSLSELFGKLPLNPQLFTLVSLCTNSLRDGLVGGGG